MPKTREVESYSNEYWTLVRECGDEGKIWTLTFPNLKEAQKARAYFYAFRSALTKKCAEEEMKGVVMPTHKRALEQAQRTVCWIDPDWAGGTIVVRFFHKDQHPQAVMLQRAEVTQGPTPPLPRGVGEAEVEEMEKQFQERLKREQVDPTGGKYG